MAVTIEQSCDYTVINITELYTKKYVNHTLILEKKPKIGYICPVLLCTHLCSKQNAWYKPDITMHC